MEHHDPFAPLPSGKSPFIRYLISENGLAREGFQAWVFSTAMLFKSPGKWWGDGGERATPHEGVDFLFYRNDHGSVLTLAPGTLVPVMYDGVVAGIIDDFLGKSVMVSHRLPGCGHVLLSIYGHTLPFAATRAGKFVNAGDIIATLADRGKSKAGVHPHLHLSLGWFLKVSPEEIPDWERLNDPTTITMIDPLAVIDAPYQVLSPGEEKRLVAGKPHR